MGTTNTIDNRIVTLENAFFLLIETDDSYSIITFPLAYHDLDKGIIEGNKNPHRVLVYRDLLCWDVVPPGIEPGTPGFSVLCSTN